MKSFRMSKNNFCTLNIWRVRALRCSITFFFETPCISSIIIICSILKNFIRIQRNSQQLSINKHVTKVKIALLTADY